LFVRVVRFEDVDPDRVEQISREIGTGDESRRPEGIKATGLHMVLDRDQRTVVVLQFFDSAQDMADSEAAFDSMDPGDTPGKRVSVDRGERLLELSM
jgi:hypothetical protein